MVTKDVVSKSPGCLPSLLSVSADDGTVSGLRSRGANLDQRSSTPPEAFEPPLASVEGKTYTPPRRRAYMPNRCGSVNTRT